MSVPMVTVFKNIGVCMIATGDTVFFKNKHSDMIKFSLFLMVFGSLCAALTDPESTYEAYFWMGL